MVAETETQVKEYEQQYQDGLITQGEKYNKVVDAWSKCTDDVAEAMMKEISKLEPGKPINSVYMMVPFRRSWFGRSNEAAGRHARPDGQAVG